MDDMELANGSKTAKAYKQTVTTRQTPAYAVTPSNSAMV
jgi:hypothetical protein